MQKMNDFFVKNLARIRKFYDEVLQAPVAPDVVTDYVTPDPNALQNALQTLWLHIRNYEAKLLEAAKTLQPDDLSEEAVAALKELKELYHDVQPKKARKGDKKKKSAE